MRNKKTLIIIISIVIILLIIGSVGFYLYAKTDMFKSSKQLFWKYAVNGIEKIEQLKPIEEADYIPNLSENSYTRESSLDIISEYNGEDKNTTKLLEKLAKTNMKITTNVNSKNKKQSSIIDLYYGTEKLFELSYLRNKDEYALKSDEIANGYIGIKNSDLKQFVEKLEIFDINNVPDNIDVDNLNGLTTVSIEEKEHISSTYQDVLLSTIPDECYSKAKKEKVITTGGVYTANSYTLVLTEKQAQEVTIKMLEKIKEDSQTLNLISTKLKLLSFTEEYTDINKLNEKISNLIEKIQQIETTDNQFVTITVYEAKGKTIRMDITRKNTTYQFEIDKDNQVILKLVNHDEQILPIKEISILKETSNEKEQFTINTKLSNYEENSEQFTVTIQRYKENELYYNKVDAVYNKDESKITATLLQKTTIVEQMEKIENISETKSILLNDLTQKQTNNLIKALKSRIKTIYQEKLDVIGLSSTQTIKSTMEIADDTTNSTTDNDASNTNITE